jgi:hypothetical protein
LRDGGQNVEVSQFEAAADLLDPIHFTTHSRRL